MSILAAMVSRLLYMTKPSIGEMFGDHPTPFVVVRPDRLIAAQFEGEQGQQTAARFAKLLRPSED